MIKDYKNKTSGPIKGTFLISKIDYKPFANKPGTFLTCEFTDLSGSIKAIMWDGFAFYKSWLKNKTVVDTVGEISTFKDMSQVQIKSLAQATDYDVNLLVPSLSAEEIKKIEMGLISFKKTIKNEVCEKIWNRIFDVHIFPEYLACPGGVGEVHHNYRGGLAEHSYAMIQVGDFVSQQQKLDRDIVLTGCLIHDIGKMQCYNWSLVIEMTDAGRLLHHTYMGYGMLVNMAEKLDISLDDPTFLKLAHIVVAHHEAEGIRKTMFAEANAVAQIDAMNALVAHAVDYSSSPENKDENSNWTRFCSLTQRQYYIPVQQIPEIKQSSEIKSDPLIVSIDELFGDDK